MRVSWATALVISGIDAHSLQRHHHHHHKRTD